MMSIPLVTLPRLVPLQQSRAPQENIPQTRSLREQIKRLSETYIRQVNPTPPLSFNELRQHADRFIEQHGIAPAYRDYIAVILNGEVWRETLATVPYERRLLLLPKCLRVEDKCPAPFDEFGLLCRQCGLCSIQDLQNEAERLGYAVLVAEGSALVMNIIQTGKIDAIVGVSCLSVLEKAFPYMESAAIPGVAIPLLQDDCKDTVVDIDWVWDVIHLTSDDRTYRLNLDELRREVDSWFEPEALEELMGPADTETERISRAWLAGNGKRWRPFLLACVYRALRSGSGAGDDAPENLPIDLRKLAVAVECFHKASLVHDDIEDDDALRYGQKTLHEEHGIPIALNAGDLLIGEGYRLIAETQAPARARARMLQVAAVGHRTLCLGQGAELSWMRNPRPLGSLEVLDIFRRKTAPAFEVALRLGAIYARPEQDLSDILGRYSEALGIAYQIRDDIDDLAGEGDDIAARRPTLPLALALERCPRSRRPLLERAWRREEAQTGQVRAVLDELRIEHRCRMLLESYKEQAIRTLAELDDPSLKGLLRRVIGKIFTVTIEGWCSEFEARNAAGSEAGAAAAG
jgi:geranylgeranyl diphosphate synthase, type II